MKEKLKLKNDSELAAYLGIASGTISNWKNRNKIPYEELFSICEKNNIDIGYIFYGKTIFDKSDIISIPQQITALVNKSYELDPHGLQKKLIEFILENSVKRKLKHYDETQPFLKFFFGERLDKMSSYRIIIKALKNSNIDLETLKTEDAKEILLDIIKNYKLQMVDFVNYTLTEKDHTNALKFIETLENLDAYIILMDIKLAIEAFNESIKYLTVTPLKQKITGKD